MDNPLDSFTDLPKPVQAIALLGSGAGLVTVFMAISTHDFAWKVAAGLLIGVGVLMVLFKLGLMLWDKRKSGPFSSLISRTAGGRGASDPAQKARMDDLRKKFEEGVAKFKSAGKDLYSLPWYLVVGTPGSGKTEMVRHSNVGFPQGLQDVQQGAGGTMNMNWWFTNHAVMLDTAGRMFMEESEGQNTEWKEFLKLLRNNRPQCPINGLLLVIPSESLLKDSNEKIEKWAGAIARQLDVIQRLLEVRFPVTVIVTKCDKIVGFREFFENISDAVLQHQILGWSNPASLDEVFKPDEVTRHLDSVRDKLNKRRAGLMQNPAHTTDPNGRRVDEVDEMFELPGNLVRIAPTLRLYLEKIFVAGEWSPKPLFLRGIYFTSSMREGQALDIALAQALGVDAESLAGGKEYDKEKAYFLKDVFLGKVFKERGLVTAATHVGKTVARQRRWMIGSSLLAALLVGGATLASIFGYTKSFKEPKKTWDSVRNALKANEAATVKAGEARPLAIFAAGTDGKMQYLGKDPSGLGSTETPDGVKVRSDLLAVTGEQTALIPDPLVAKPVLYLLKMRGSDFVDKQIDAHRAVVERTVLKPLVDQVRGKLSKETAWGEDAVGALAQLVRLTTLSEGKEPMKNPPAAGGKAADDWELVDVEVLSRYALGDDFTKAFPNSKDDVELKKLKKAVAKAYPAGFPGGGDDKKSGGSESLFGSDREAAHKQLVAALTNLGSAMANQTPSEESNLGKFVKLIGALKAFDEAEGKYADELAWLGDPSAPGEAAAKATVKGYQDFAAKYRAKFEAIDKAREMVAVQAGKYKPEDLADPAKLLDVVQKQRAEEIDKTIKDLRDQLPTKGAVLPARLAVLDAMFDDSKDTSVSQTMRKSLKTRVAELGETLKPVGMLLAGGTMDGAPNTKLFDALQATHKAAVEALNDGEKKPAAEPTVSAKFSSLRKAQAKGAKELADKLDKRLAWNTGQLEGSKRLERGVGAAKRVVVIGQMRGTYGLADAAIGEKVWEDGEAVAAAVAGLPEEMAGAGEGADAGKQIEKRAPLVPLSSLREATSYDAKFLPEGASRLVGAWREIHQLAEGKVDAKVDPGTIARDELLTKVTKTSHGDNAVSDYASLYAGYWSGLALEKAMPKGASWKEFKEGVTRLADRKGDVAESLKKLYGRTNDAFDAFTQAAGTVKVIDDAKKSVGEEYKGVATDKPMDGLIGKWGALDADPMVAAAAVRRSIKAGKKEYVQDFGDKSQNNYLKYRDQFILSGINSLVQATGTGIDKAWQTLSSTKGIPLTAGTDAELTEDQMRSLSDAVKTLGEPGTKGEKSDLETLVSDSTLREAVRGLLGDDYISGEAKEQWFARVSSLLKTFSKPTRVTVKFFMDPNEPNRMGALKRAGDKWSYAGFWINGQPASKGPLNNIGTGGTSTALDISVPGSDTAEIRLFDEDPKGVEAKMAAPNERKIPLSTGRWGPLKVMLSNLERVVKSADGKSFNVGVVTPDGANYVWLVMTVEPAEDTPKLPDLADWPRADKWPPK